MSNYFKIYTESHNGVEGDFYFEVQNNLIVRQVNSFQWGHYWATPEDSFDGQYDFTSNPEFEVDETTILISKEEFEQLWNIAIRQK